MTSLQAIYVEDVKEQKVARRDWILLPVLSLFTIGVIAVSTEVIARWVFSDSKTLLANCMVLDDPTTGPRAIPNSVCWEKSPESALTEYRFDSCGYRAGTKCGPKPPGTYRIVLTGSSVALGERVLAEESFASLLPLDLSQRTGRKIEVYNEGMGWGFASTVNLRFNQILDAKPDLILWVLTPADIEGAALVVQATKSEREQLSQSLREKAWRRAKTAFRSESAAIAFSELFLRTRTALLLRHMIFQNQSQYVNSTLMKEDGEVGFLKSDFSAEWESHLRQFDMDVAKVADRAKVAEVPLIAVFVPYSAQAAMISMGEWPPAYDPYKLGNKLGKIVESHGGIYLDILPQFRVIPNPERGYFPVDTHPNVAGHRMIAHILAKELTSGAVPALGTAAHSQLSSEQRR